MDSKEMYSQKTSAEAVRFVIGLLKLALMYLYTCMPEDLSNAVMKECADAVLEPDESRKKEKVNDILIWVQREICDINMELDSDLDFF